MADTESTATPGPKYNRAERFVKFVGLRILNWGHPTYSGTDLLRTPGGVLLVANHDSQMDPLCMAGEFVQFRFPRFLARANLWDIPIFRRLLRAMKHIPVQRGTGDSGAMDAAVEALRQGELVIIYPEGTLSRGRSLKAHSGVARLARACPEATIVCCAITGSTEYVKNFPRRPDRVHAEFFLPATPTIGPDDDLNDYAASLLAEIRAKVPPVKAGRTKRRGHG